MKRELTRQEATARREELGVRGDQCTADLCKKLYQWGIKLPYDDIIEHLEEQKFVDDERFARAYVRDKYRFDRWGRMKIARGLIAKRIPQQVIREALTEVDVKEYAMNCYRLLAAKRKQLPADLDSWTLREKLMRFAAARGYEAGLIVKLLDNKRLWESQED